MMCLSTDNDALQGKQGELARLIVYLTGSDQAVKLRDNVWMEL